MPPPLATQDPTHDFPLACDWAHIVDNLDHNAGHGQARNN